MINKIILLISERTTETSIQTSLNDRYTILSSSPSNKLTNIIHSKSLLKQYKLDEKSHIILVCSSRNKHCKSSIISSLLISSPMLNATQRSQRQRVMHATLEMNMQCKCSKAQHNKPKQHGVPNRNCATHYCT